MELLERLTNRSGVLSSATGNWRAFLSKAAACGRHAPPRKCRIAETPLPLFPSTDRDAMQVFQEPKIDTHCHLLDPVRFPYANDVAYRPQGQEIGDQASFEQVMDCHGVKHALLVGPNSGYNLDNRCMLHALATGAGRF